MIKENVYEILGNSIKFQYYNLFFSTLHKVSTITSDRINAVDLYTSPPSLIIDNGEIIFLNHNDTPLLTEFATGNNVPLTTHIDTWSMLTRDYLDTEWNNETIIAQNEQLAGVGIDQNEFKKISKALKPILLGTLEWTYLGLWDVLAMKQQRDPLYRFFGKKYYWQAMSLALKGSGYEIKEDLNQRS